MTSLAEQAILQDSQRPLRTMPVQDVASWPFTFAQKETGMITVWVGSPSRFIGLQGNDLILIVDADHEEIENLQSSYQSNDHAVFYQGVLTARDNSLIQWFTYNHTRLNGPLDAQALSHIYPNLRQVGVEQRRGCTLEDLLSSAGQNLVYGPATELKIFLRQGDPMAALDGLGSWIHALRHVELDMPADVTAFWGQQVGAWLEQKGFVADDNSESTRWKRNAVASQLWLLREHDQLLQRVEDLEGQVKQLLDINERLETQNKHHQLQQEQVTREIQALNARLDQELMSDDQ